VRYIVLQVLQENAGAMWAIARFHERYRDEYEMIRKGKWGDKDRRRVLSELDIRRSIQAVVLILTLGMGIQFALYVAAAAGDGLMTIPRPSSVEGFLPIGALMGWKRFLTTGAWDPVHPAAMAIFGFVILVSFLLRNAFCGWLCPVGTVSEWLYRAGETLFGRTFRLPAVIDVPLRGLKYVLLGFFAWIIYSMSAEAIGGFQASPYYRMADVKMLYFFLNPSTTTLVVLSLLVILSLVVRQFWCRYMCPYGALTGLVAAIGPTRIRRNSEACANCGKCRASCPKHLPVDKKSRIASAECVGCMQCVAACPADNVLTFRTAAFRRGWPVKKVGMALVIGWMLMVYAATFSGIWKSGVSDTEFRMRLRQVNGSAYEHPTTPLVSPKDKEVPSWPHQPVK